MEKKRDSFIFYRSFMEALSELNDTQYAKVFRAISKYFPILTIAMCVFALITGWIIFVHNG